MSYGYINLRPAIRAAVGKFPYKHRTLAQVSKDEGWLMDCAKCGTKTSGPCAYYRCPFAKKGRR